MQATQRYLRERKGKWLLLLDDTAQDITHLLPRDDGGNPIGHVLMTAQKQHQWPQLTAHHHIDVLTTDQSMELLEKDKVATSFPNPILIASTFSQQPCNLLTPLT